LDVSFIAWVQLARLQKLGLVMYISLRVTKKDVSASPFCVIASEAKQSRSEIATHKLLNAVAYFVRITALKTLARV